MVVSRSEIVISGEFPNKPTPYRMFSEALVRVIISKSESCDDKYSAGRNKLETCVYAM